jgi:hypothetical protein
MESQNLGFRRMWQRFPGSIRFEPSPMQIDVLMPVWILFWSEGRKVSPLKKGESQGRREVV